MLLIRNEDGEANREKRPMTRFNTDPKPPNLEFGAKDALLHKLRRMEISILGFSSKFTLKGDISQKSENFQILWCLGILLKLFSRSQFREMLFCLKYIQTNQFLFDPSDCFEFLPKCIKCRKMRRFYILCCDFSESQFFFKTYTTFILKQNSV